MLLTALTALMLLTSAPPTLPRDPNLPPEPTPMQEKASGSVRFTNLENTVVTLSMEDNIKKVSWKAVKTPDGTRIRITMGDVTVDTTRVTIKRPREMGYEIYEMSLNKEGHIEISARLEPKPKQH